MILIARPRVFRRGPRWRVDAVHTGGIHIEEWRTWETAMDCALAIARTSTCRPIAPPTEAPQQHWGVWTHF